MLVCCLALICDNGGGSFLMFHVCQLGRSSTFNPALIVGVSSITRLACFGRAICFGSRSDLVGFDPKFPFLYAIFVGVTDKDLSMYLVVWSYRNTALTPTPHQSILAQAELFSAG